jgi:hypothetical protein
VSGTLNTESSSQFDEGWALTFISPRYEQLCTASGSITIEGQTWNFAGTALRVHRQGLRDSTGFWGHVWPSALFPSGKGFGALAFPERGGLQPTYNEGFIFDGKSVIPALLVDAPWIDHVEPVGEDVSFTLRTEDGDVQIKGESAFSSYMAPGTTYAEFAPFLQQAGVRYRWDGEETYGMMERSIPADQMKA